MAILWPNKGRIHELQHVDFLMVAERGRQMEVGHEVASGPGGWCQRGTAPPRPQNRYRPGRLLKVGVPGAGGVGWWGNGGTNVHAALRLLRGRVAK